MLHHVIFKKLDVTSYAHYQQSLQKLREVQHLYQLLDFVELQFQALESLGHKTWKTKNKTALVSIISYHRISQAAYKWVKFTHHL